MGLEKFRMVAIQTHLGVTARAGKEKRARLELLPISPGSWQRNSCSLGKVWGMSCARRVSQDSKDGGVNWTTLLAMQWGYPALLDIATFSECFCDIFLTANLSAKWPDLNNSRWMKTNVSRKTGMTLLEMLRRFAILRWNSHFQGETWLLLLRF